MYPFTGIRGDAKELYAKLKNGLVKNVDLIKAESKMEQA